MSDPEHASSVAQDATQNNRPRPAPVTCAQTQTVPESALTSLSTSELRVVAELLGQLHQEIESLREEARFMRGELIARRAETDRHFQVLQAQAKAISDIANPPRHAPSPENSWRSRDHWVWAAAALLFVVLATLLLFNRLLQDTNAASPSTTSADDRGRYTLNTSAHRQPAELLPSLTVRAPGSQSVERADLDTSAR